MENRKLGNASVNWELIFKEIQRIKSMPDWTGGSYTEGYLAAVKDIEDSLEAMSNDKSVWRIPTT